MRHSAVGSAHLLGFFPEYKGAEELRVRPAVAMTTPQVPVGAASSLQRAWLLRGSLSWLVMIAAQNGARRLGCFADMERYLGGSASLPLWFMGPASG